MPLANTYQDNISNLLPKADYGIKISKVGFDVSTAADNDLLFNSSWPSVQIVKVKTIVQTVADTTIVSHGLTFPPAAFVIGGTGNARAMVGCDVDDTNVYVPSNVFGVTVGDTLGVLVIYHVDISVDVEYPYTNIQSLNTEYNPDYGIKMVKSGRNIDSTDLRDYILHSRCGSPLILAVKTEETVNPSNPIIVQYTSRLSYPTLNFGYSGVAAGTAGLGFTYGTNAYQFAPQQSQAVPITFTDGFTSYTTLGNGRASIICLRSPMFATTNTVLVNY
jgi:hypothetical protein